MRDDRTYTVYTHRVVTEDNGPMYYVGVTYQKLSRRWKPSAYKATALEPYIIQYGWDNIEHRVFYDGLDHEMALKIEDTLIRLYRHFDCCINQQRSGLIKVSNQRSYWNEWHHKKYDNDVEYAERLRKYDRERKRKKRAENKQKQLQQNDDL